MSGTTLRGIKIDYIFSDTTTVEYDFSSIDNILHEIGKIKTAKTVAGSTLENAVREYAKNLERSTEIVEAYAAKIKDVIRN